MHLIKISFNLVRRQLYSFSSRTYFCSSFYGKRNFSNTQRRPIEKSIWPDIVVPEVSIQDFIFNKVSEYSSKPALINALTGSVLTFDQVKDSTWRIASGLTRLGFKTNDKILFLSENSVEYILLFHAVLWIGGTVTMCNPHYLMGDISRQAVDAEVSYIFTSHLCLSKTLDVCKNLKSQIKRVITINNEAGCIPISHLLSDDGKAFPKNVQIDFKNHTALLPYSSGTTGLPKGVMLTHYSEVANTLQSDVNDLALDIENNIQLGLLPFYHSYGFLIYFMFGLYKGQTTVIIPGFDPKLFCTVIQKYKIKMMHVVPPIVLFLNKHPMTQKFDLSSLCRIFSAAAPLGKEMVEEMHIKRPHCTVGQAFGMTETGPAVTVNPFLSCRTKPSSSGMPLPSTLLKIINEKGEECVDGIQGEVCIKGPQLMKGYYKNPSATASTIDPEGWLHSGDIGYLEDGHLFVVDRVKELIKYKGLQVPPAELEAILCSHVSVADAAVIGIPDDEAGELPRAFIALKPGAKVDTDDIEKFVEKQVVSYKKLRGGVVVIDAIPRSPTGKILRRELRSLKS